MKKLLVILAAAMVAACRGPITMYDPEYDDRVSREVYYERHPEESETITVTITVK